MDYRTLLAGIVAAIVLSLSAAGYEPVNQSGMDEQALIGQLEQSGIGTEFFTGTFRLIKEENNMSSPNRTKIDYMHLRMNERKDKAFYLLDYITATRSKIEDFNVSKGIDVREESIMLDEALSLLRAEKFEDAESLLDSIDKRLDSKYSEKISIKTFALAGQSFLQQQKRWIAIISGIILLGILISIYPAYRSRIRRKAKALALEERVITGMMRDVQGEYFKSKSIPQDIYKIKMDAYRRRLAEIKEQLPLLESRIGKAENKRIVLMRVK